MNHLRHLVVGLGNPGPTYVATRHNVGFWAVSDLASRHDAAFTLNSRLRAEVATVTTPDLGKLILAKPTTFMNESGAACRALAAFYQIEPSNIIVIHDELDLDAGRLRLKFGGGDNGHNGLKSIRSQLGTGDFYRVRVGIGRPEGRRSASSYVLARLTPGELDGLRLDAAVAADAAEVLITDGLVASQNRFNS